MKLYSILAILTLVLAACTTVTPPIRVSPLSPLTSAPGASPLSPLAIPQASGEPVIIFEREGGLAGTHETWRIYADGRIEAQSQKGATWTRLTREAVTSALQRIADSRFFTLGDSYMPANRCCDRFTYKLTIIQGRTGKTVTTMDGADQPAALTEALTAVRELIETAQMASEGSTATPSKPDERMAIFPNTLIVYQQQAGSSGDSKQWTFYHTGRIVAGDGTEWQTSAERVKLLFNLAEAPDYWKLNDDYPAVGRCADCTVHILTVYQEGKIKKITITQGANLPANLQQMLDEMNSLIAR